ncbi:MAG: Uma2 family endonuclease [Hyphomonadaceae bacterium]|nr:Uma2 family endonuclease [Hyphomonadaceae bacterium]
MNAPLYPPAQHVKRKLSVDDAIKLKASGVFYPDDPELEVIDGDLYELPADGPRTRRWNAAIARWLFSNLGPDYVIMPDKTLPVSTYYGPQPDFYIFDAAIRDEDVSGAHVLLVIEVADTTMDMDSRVKAPRYAEGGVREYWLIDVEARRTLVHRLREDGAYDEPSEIAYDQPVHALLIPDLTLTLSSLPRLD